MLLYAIDDKKLTVYDFSANRDDLMEYRITKMEQIPEEERLFKAITHKNPYGETPLFELYTDGNFKDEIVESSYADNIERRNDDAYGRYHVLKKDKLNKNNKKLLSNYYFGYLVDKNVVRIKYLEMMKYFLLCNKEYKYLGTYDVGKIYQMQGIIQIPESLYLLQLIEQERFQSIGDSDIKEQLSLYSLSKTNEFDMEDLRKMDNFKITNDAYHKAINKAKNDKHILQLLKK